MVSQRVNNVLFLSLGLRFAGTPETGVEADHHDADPTAGLARATAPGLDPAGEDRVLATGQGLSPEEGVILATAASLEAAPGPSPDRDHAAETDREARMHLKGKTVNSVTFQLKDPRKQNTCGRVCVCICGFSCEIL